MLSTADSASRAEGTLPMHAICVLASALVGRGVSAGRNSRAVRAGGNDSGAVLQ